MSPRSLSNRVAGRIENGAGLDRLVEPLHRGASAIMPGGALRDLLSGRQLGHPAHPAWVSLPAGCWTGATVLDALGERRGARSLIGFGVISAFPVAAAGLSDWVDTDGAERRVGAVHLLANVAATAAYAASWWERRHRRHARGVALALAGAALASAGGWLGGHLAYALGVGVDANAFSAGTLPWTLLDADPPPDGSPVRAVVGGSPVLVSDQPGGTRVLADRCSHRGAPLSDGQIAHGCVTCPWHGSEFDLSTGEVRRGPATAPQPTYATRTESGRLEVRRDEERALRNNTTQAV